MWHEFLIFPYPLIEVGCLEAQAWGGGEGCRMSSSDSRTFPAIAFTCLLQQGGPHYLCQATVKQSRKKTGAREMAQQLGALALVWDQRSPHIRQFTTPVIPAPKDPMYFP